MQLSSLTLNQNLEKLNIVGSYRDSILSEFNNLSIDEQNAIFSSDHRLYIDYERESARELAYLAEHSLDRITTPKIFSDYSPSCNQLLVDMLREEEAYLTQAVLPGKDELYDQTENEPHTIVLLGMDYLSALSLYIEPLRLSGCINIVIIENLVSYL